MASKAAPVVKWAGGKTRLLPELLKRVPRTYGRYFEPFAGGAALFFHLAPAHGVLSDTNSDLIATYVAVRDDVELLIRKLRRHARLHDKQHYYTTRFRWNEGRARAEIDRAASFIYLNKTCFNGLWRVNRDGAFNVPMGRYAAPAICKPVVLRAAHEALARTELHCHDYRAASTHAERGDFIYFDPPYDPITKSASFTSYTAAAFGADQQRELAETASALAARGVRVMLSNSDTRFIRSLYRNFTIDRVKCSRAINSNAARRGKVNELIITGGLRS